MLKCLSCIYVVVIEKKRGHMSFPNPFPIYLENASKVIRGGGITNRWRKRSVFHIVHTSGVYCELICRQNGDEPQAAPHLFLSDKKQKWWLRQLRAVCCYVIYVGNMFLSFFKLHLVTNATPGQRQHQRVLYLKCKMMSTEDKDKSIASKTLNIK